MDLPGRYHKLNFSGAIFFALAFLLSFVSSCGPDNHTPNGYSPGFEKIIHHADTLFGTNQVKKGLHILDSAYAKIKNPTPDDQFKIASFHYIYAHNVANDNKRAIACADSMLLAANLNPKSPNYYRYFAEAEFGKGDAYFALGKYNEAYPYFLTGYNVGKDHLSSITLQTFTYHMGMITYKIGSYKLAANYFEASYNYHHPEPADFVEYYAMQELLDNIGLSFKHEGLPDSAIFYFDKNLKFIAQYGPRYTDRLKMNELASGVVYGNKAEVLAARKDYQGAEQMLRKSIAITSKKDYDNNDAVLSEIKLAQLYFDNGQYAELSQLLDTLKLQLTIIKNEDAIADWNRLMSGYAFKKGDLKNAYSYLHTYNTLKDSTNKKLSALRESDINKLIDSYEHQQQIDEIASNNRYKRIYLIAALIVSALTLLVLWLIARNWMRSRKDIARVSQLNRQINEQNVSLNTALGELKTSSNEKDRILHAVAHDLRNPLGGISSLSSLALEDAETEDQREQIDLIRQTSVNALELINEILEVTNITPARVNIEKVDMNAKVNNCVSLLQFKALEKNQTITVDLPQQHIYLNINREKIWRVISNLIINAIKFSPDNSPIKITLSLVSGNVQVSVEDNGVGIPEKYRDQIFNMFTTAKRPGTAGEKSFGLGLSICKQIIEQFNGKIWFESKPAGGTIFYISIPANVE